MRRHYGDLRPVGQVPMLYCCQFLCELSLPGKVTRTIVAIQDAEGRVESFIIVFVSCADKVLALFIVVIPIRCIRKQSTNAEVDDTYPTE